MRELAAILAAYDQCRARQQTCVLATVVHVEGSAYRRAGARMLISEAGYMTGSISGGCLEGDALKKAMRALHQGQNKLVTYDTNDESDAIIGAQLGCNGVIQVLFEPILSHDPAPLPIQLLRQLAQKQEAAVLATLFNLDKQSPQAGTSILYDAQLHPTGTIADPLLSNAIAEAAAEALLQRNSLFETYHLNGTTVSAFIAYCAAPIKLLLVGAGNDAQILAQMAHLLGWNVTVADGRHTHANPQRFYPACEIVVAKPDKLLENVSIDEQTAVVLMTHNYLYDKAVLQQLLPLAQIPYIGILGPRKRFNRMLEELQTEGIAIPPGDLSRIYAPVGLHLGGEQASEIGISILAEIMAVFNHAGAGHLREKPGPIHAKQRRPFTEIQL